MLLEAGADPNVVDTEAGMGPLYARGTCTGLAVGHGRPNPKPVGVMTASTLVKKLLERGADPNRRLKKATCNDTTPPGILRWVKAATPFLRAAKSGDIEMMRALVAGGADPKLAMPNGSQCAAVCAGTGLAQRQSRRAFLRSGSDEEAVEAIRFLLGIGFDINGTNEAGETALHAAVSGRVRKPSSRFSSARAQTPKQRTNAVRLPCPLRPPKASTRLQIC
jgi:hypothetical protein